MYFQPRSARHMRKHKNQLGSKPLTQFKRKPVAHMVSCLMMTGALTVMPIPATSAGLDATFTEQTGTTNPFDGIEIDILAVPELVDIDGDGDLDAFVGERNSPLRYFENTGSSTSPVYIERTGTANPFNTLDVGFNSAPNFMDIDGDGDMDAFVGENFGTVKFFENTGTASTPNFIERTGIANPLDGISAGNISTPSLNDIDGDGDLDAFIGSYTLANIQFFENTGTSTAPVFTARTGSANPLDGFFSSADLGLISNLADIDNDGDVDVVAGNLIGQTRYFENTGSATSPIFSERSSTANPFGDISNSFPELADINQDGDVDLIAGANNLAPIATLNFFENTRDTVLTPTFTQQTGSNNPFDGILGSLSTIITLADIDGDGDLDAIVGDYDSGGILLYYENTGSTTDPVYAQRTGSSNPFNGLDVGLISQPTFGDVDGDGDFDAILADDDNTINYLENTGSATNPIYIRRTGSSNPFDGIENSIPSLALGDIDGDGDQDAVIGDSNGFLFYFENTGNVTNPIYTQRTGNSNPFDGIDVGFSAKPAIFDIDGDGDLDAVVTLTESLDFTNFTIKLAFFENTGSATSPIYTQRTGTSNPFDEITFSEDIVFNPVMGDVDTDGDLDIVIGNDAGTVLFFENTSGEFLSSETFDYPDGSISGQSGGTGWGGAWSGNNDVSGGGLITPGSSFRALDNVITHTPGSRVYLGFDMSSNGGLDVTFAGISFFNADDEELFIGSPFGDNQFGFDTVGASFTGTRLSGVTIGSTPTRVVIEILFGETNTTINMYLDPTDKLGTPVASITAATADLGGSWDQLRVAGGGDVSFDNIGVSNSLADVLTIDQPGAVTNDFTGDERADILARNNSTGLWRLHPVEGRFVQFDDNFGLVSLSADLTLQTQDVSDFTGDGLADVLLRNTTTGAWTLTALNGKTVVDDGSVNLPTDLSWQLVAAEDFTGDGKTDVVLRHTVNGTWQLYPMDGRTVLQDSNRGSIAITPDLSWSPVAASDFNGDGFSDLLLRNTVSGLWLMIPLQGRTVIRDTDFGGVPITQDLSWEVAGDRDLTGDGSADLLLRNNVSGQWLLLPLNGKSVDRGNNFGGIRFLETNLDWQPVQVDDFTGDGKADIVIRNIQTGAWRMHPMNGNNVVRDSNFGGVAVTSDLNWELQ